MSTVRPTAISPRIPASSRTSARTSGLGRARPAALLVTGVVGVSVAAPIALSHIIKIGMNGPAVVGSVAALGSLFLVVAGITGLVRHTSWLRKLAVAAVALALFQFVMFPLANAVYVTNAAHPQAGTRTPADVGLSYTDATLISDDGTQLAAWYAPSENGAAIVLRHGSGSTKTATIDHAALLADAGYGVLLMDARGHGDSEGRINELGWHGKEDIAAAVDFLESNHEITNGIGILGLSMGGEEALNYAARDERVAAVVAEGVGVGTYPDAVADDPNPFERSVEWTQFMLTDLLSDVPPPEGVAASMPDIGPRPVLLITGEEKIESTMGPIYAAAGGPTTTLWELPEVAHTDAIAERPDEYRTTILGFFADALLEGGRT